jgi:hypothetical protein
VFGTNSRNSHLRCEKKKKGGVSAAALTGRGIRRSTVCQECIDSVARIQAYSVHKRTSKACLRSNFSQFVLIFDIVPPLWKRNRPVYQIPWLWISGADECKSEEPYHQVKLARERGRHGAGLLLLLLLLLLLCAVLCCVFN